LNFKLHALAPRSFIAKTTPAIGVQFSVFMLLVALYSNLKFPLISVLEVHLTAPVGGIAALWLTHTPFFVSSGGGGQYEWQARTAMTGTDLSVYLIIRASKSERLSNKSWNKAFNESGGASQGCCLRSGDLHSRPKNFGIDFSMPKRVCSSISYCSG